MKSEMNEDYKIMFETIGKNIKKQRLLKNYTQRKLANELNVSANCISLIELGKTCPSMPLAIDICKKLNVSFYSIFEDTDIVQTSGVKELNEKLETLGEDDKEIINALVSHLYNRQRSKELIKQKHSK